MLLFGLGISSLVAEQLNILDVSEIKTIERKADISKVELYSDGAYVQREARLVLQPGIYKLELSGLPEDLDVSKMNIELEGAELLRVASEFSSIKSHNGQEYQQLIKAIEDNEEQQERTRSSKLILEADVRTIATAKALKISSERPLDKNLKLYSESWSSSIAHLDARQRENNSKMLVLDQALEKQKEQQKKLVQKAKEILAEEASEKRIWIVFEQKQSSSRILLSYVLSQAGWDLTTKVLFNSQDNSVYLQRNARVSQVTGEDWSGVELSFYSGSSETASFFPKVYGAYFDGGYFVPKAREKEVANDLIFSKSETKVEALKEFPEAAHFKMELADQVKRIELQERSFATQNIGELPLSTEAMREDILKSLPQMSSGNRVDRPRDQVEPLRHIQQEEVDLNRFLQERGSFSTLEHSSKSISELKSLTLKSGSSPLVVSLDNVAITGAFFYESVPALERGAYLKFRPQLQDLTVLEGVSVFGDGRFRGVISSEQFQGDGVEIALGLDKNVVVERSFQSEDPQIKMGMSSMDYRCTIELSNKHKHPIQIRLIEPIPKSLDIDIKIVDSSHSFEEGSGTTGVLWNLDLQPDQSEVVTLHYRMTYPQGTIILSGDR